MEGRPLDEVPFVVLDFETTGLDPDSGDRVCEVGAVKLRGGVKGERFWTLVDPGRPVSQGAFSVHHITQEMLRGAPRMEEVLPELLEFLGEDVLAAYNASFEMKFLRSEMMYAGLPPPSNPVVDVLSLARRLLPGLVRVPEVSAADWLRDLRLPSRAVELLLRPLLLAALNGEPEEVSARYAALAIRRVLLAPRGGALGFFRVPMSRIWERVVPLVESAGGEVRTGARGAGVIVECGRAVGVRGAGGGGSSFVEPLGTTISAGTETGMMPIGLERHVAESVEERKAVYGDIPGLSPYIT